MSAITIISAEEISAILGPDFQAPAVTFESVWETMKIRRVFRKETDFLPDSWQELYGKLETFLPIRGVRIGAVGVVA
jgi:hypothetical protein